MSNETEFYTLAELQDGLRKLDISDDQMPYATLLMASAHFGPNVEHLCGFTGYELPFVREVYDRMVASEIWLPSGHVQADWFEEPAEGKEDSSGMAFLMDVMVAMGLLTKSWDELPTPASADLA